MQPKKGQKNRATRARTRLVFGAVSDMMTCIASVKRRTRVDAVHIVACVAYVEKMAQLCIERRVGRIHLQG
jgi:hypothetical protein